VSKICYVCKYTPLELFAGFGTECERLDPAPVNFDCADSCAHPNLCGFGKAVIEAVAARDVQELILTDCCDVCRRIYDVLKLSGKLRFLYLLPLPHKSGDAEGRLLADELERLAERWASYSGETFDVSRALAAWEEGRRAAAAAAVNEPHISLAGAHGGSQLLAVMRPRFSLPVTDDTCTGRRTLAPSPETAAEEADFFRVYAPALLRQERPCLRMLESRGRVSADADAAAIVFHTVKFCDYYSFE